MFGKKKEEPEELNEDQHLIKKVFEFPWALMFEDVPAGGIFTRLFPYIAVALLALNLIISAVK